VGYVPPTRPLTVAPLHHSTATGSHSCFRLNIKRVPSVPHTLTEDPQLWDTDKQNQPRTNYEKWQTIALRSSSFLQIYLLHALLASGQPAENFIVIVGMHVLASLSLSISNELSCTALQVSMWEYPLTLWNNIFKKQLISLSKWIVCCCWCSANHFFETKAKCKLET